MREMHQVVEAYAAGKRSNGHSGNSQSEG